MEKSAPPPDVQRAIDLVDEAAEKLASPAKDSIKFMDTYPGAWRRRKQAPRNPGSKVGWCCCGGCSAYMQDCAACACSPKQHSHQ